MKMLIFAAAAACLASPVTVSAESSPIVVSPDPIQEWVASTSRQLDRALDRLDVSQAPDGISIVRFTANADGKPMNVETVSRDSFELNRVARVAVQRLRLDPLKSVSENQVYEAAIVLAGTPRKRAELRSRVAARSAEQNTKLAASGMPNTVIAISGIAAF